MGEKQTQTIMIDEVEYNVDDFTDEQRVFISHIMDLDRKINSTQFNLDQLNVGRGAFMKALKETLTPDPEPQQQQEAA